MEEILTSIRRIISDDKISKPEKGLGENTEPDEISISAEDYAGDDILELTEKVDDLADDGNDDGETLLSAAAAGAATATFAELAKAMDQETEIVSKIALREGSTLEDLVKNLVRPMLKEWLDQNLPTLVENLVRKEIQRMVSRAGDL